MTTFLALYVGTGLGLAMTAISLPDVRRCIDLLATGVGMTRGYGRMIWVGGTVLAWPIGLYVLTTGHLVLTNVGLSAIDNQESSKERPIRTETV